MAVINTAGPAPKDPEAILDYQLDLRPYLAPGETVVESSITITAPGLQINPGGRETVYDQGVITYWLGGGTHGQTIIVSIVWTTQLAGVVMRTDAVRFNLGINFNVR